MPRPSSDGLETARRESREHCPQETRRIGLNAKPGFTDNDANEIPYWIESVSGTLATIWVKVPSISDTTIWIYYGNESASTTSNGDTTFIFFDDFTTLDTDKWDTTTYIGGGSVSVSDGKLTIAKTSTSNLNMPVVFTKNKLNTANTIIETSMVINTLCPIQVGMHLRSSMSSDTSYRLYFVECSTPSTEDMYADFTGDGSYDVYSNFCSWAASTPYRLKFIIGSSSTTWVQNETQTSYAATFNQLAYFTLGAYNPVVVSTGTFSHTHDWIFQRKYTPIEPTHGAWSEEQEVISYPLKITINPTSGTNPLSVSYNLSISDALDNFILNFGDGNVYTPPPIITNNASLTQSGSFGNTSYIVTYRNVIPAVDITTSTDNVILKLIRPTSGYYTISHASIVERSGTTADGITSPTQITFNNGNAGISISSAGDQDRKSVV